MSETIAGFAALIGDVVASRDHPDRPALQRRIAEALGATNEDVPAVQGLQATIGDEFQALYTRLDQALAATLLVRLRLRAVADVRFGIGWGALTTYDPEGAPFGQDGPAWWAARDAIGEVARLQRAREAPRGLRTACSIAAQPSSNDPLPPGLPAPRELDASVVTVLNAFVACRDELVGGMGDRDARLMLALLDGASQTEIARREEVSQAAISQRVRRSGAYAITRAQSMIEEAMT